ncbi:MAG: hypothetical protein HY301_16650, partial [Verrucomicrobia bacterium]|nr:hypothetical protein [Verrucomicrobiota bacterium]
MLVATHTNSSAIGTANVVLGNAAVLSYRIGGTNRVIVTDTNGVTTTNATADANTNFVRVNSVAVVGGMGNLDVRRPGVNIATVLNNRITFNALGITNGTLLTTGSNGYTVAFSGPVTLSGAVGISVSNSTSLSLDGALGESVPGTSLLKLGTGTLLLTNIQESTYSGGTTLNAGTLTAVAGTNTNTAVFVTNVLGTGPLTLNAGTLNLRSDTNQTLGPGAGYNVTAVSNVVINVDRFTANGGAGRILTLNSLTLGTNLFNVSSGNTYVLRFVGPATLTGNTLFSNSGSLAIDQPLNDGGGGFRVVKLNTGTLFLTNRQVQQFSGPLDIRGGTVRVDAGTNNVAGLFGAQPVVVLGGGALELRTDGFSTAFTTTNGTMLSLIVTNNGQSILRVGRAVAVGSTDRIITINNLTLTNNSIFRTENSDNYDIRIIGTTMLGTNSQFDVANGRVANPFSLEFAGPIVDTPGFASPLRKFNNANVLGYSGTNNPAFSGGTYNISGPIQWRAANLPAGAYQFGSGPITLDGAATFGFLNNVTSNYTFLNKFVINGSVAASGNPLTSGGGTIDATSQGGSPQVFFAGPVDLRGNLTVTAGAAGAYGTNLFAATFTGPFNVFGDNRRVFIGGGGAGTGARLIFSNSLVDDGTFRTTWFVANN